MNAIEAQFELKRRPLLFGDKKQIAAVRYLSEIERLQETGNGECPECEGTGEAECIACNQMTECGACEGFGVTLIPTNTDFRQRSFSY